MVAISRAVTDDDVARAAAYFSSLQPNKHIKAIETDTAPKTYIAWLIYAVSKDAGQEPIGQRIVEVPDDLDQFESYDARAEFTAYVPVGSIAKGEALVVAGGAGRTIQCGICHGPDLKGLGSHTEYRWSLAKLHRPATLRHEARPADWAVECPDGQGPSQFERGRSRVHRRLSRLSGAMTAARTEDIWLMASRPDQSAPIETPTKLLGHAEPGELCATLGPDGNRGTVASFWFCVRGRGSASSATWVKIV